MPIGAKKLAPVNDPQLAADLVNEARTQVSRELRGIHGLSSDEAGRLMMREALENLITVVPKVGGYQLRVRLPSGEYAGERELSRLTEALAAEAYLDRFGERPEKLLAERLQVLELADSARAPIVAKRFVRRQQDGSVTVSYPGGRTETGSGEEEEALLSRLAAFLVRNPDLVDRLPQEADSELTAAESAARTLDYGPVSGGGPVETKDVHVYGSL